jgi:hypothetical protein
VKALVSGKRPEKIQEKSPAGSNHQRNQETFRIFQTGRKKADERSSGTQADEETS